LDLFPSTLGYIQYEQLEDSLIIALLMHMLLLMMADDGKKHDLHEAPTKAYKEPPTYDTKIYSRGLECISRKRLRL
jgi:hypothetical protein